MQTVAAIVRGFLIIVAGAMPVIGGVGYIFQAVTTSGDNWWIIAYFSSGLVLLAAGTLWCWFIGSRVIK